MPIPSSTLALHSASILVLTLSIARLTLSAQPAPFADSTQARVRVGITAGYALNRHSADFPAIDGFLIVLYKPQQGVMPPNFRESSGSGLVAGIFATIPLVETFSLSLRGTFIQHTATLITQQFYPTRTNLDFGIDTASFYRPCGWIHRPHG
jgi:hypothetical protein